MKLEIKGIKIEENEKIDINIELSPLETKELADTWNIPVQDMISGLLKAKNGV